MSILYLHIGLPKTGTTAIQNYFQEHRCLLKDSNIHYIDTNLALSVTTSLLAASVHESDRIAATDHYRKKEYLLDGIIPLPYYYFEDNIQKKYFAALKNELQCNKDKTCIFSCEHLSLASMSGIDTNRFEYLFSNIFSEKQIRIILYIRDIEKSIASFYKEMIKAGLGTPLRDRLSNHMRPATEEHLFPNRIREMVQAKCPNCTPEEPLKLYSRLIGKDNIIVHAYKEGAEFDVIDDFLSIFSLKKQVSSPPYNINISLTNKFASYRIAYGCDTSTQDDDIASRTIISAATLNNIGKLDTVTQETLRQSAHTLQEYYHLSTNNIPDNIQKDIIAPISEFETFVCAALGKISKQNNQLLEMLHQTASPAYNFHSGHCPVFSSPGVSAQKYAEQIEQIIASRYFTSRGPYVQELEDNLEIYLQVPFVTLCTNDSIMWMLLLHAANLQGKHIALSPCMSPKLLSVLRWHHCHPIFIDIDYTTTTISEEALHKTLSRETVDAVILHHSIMEWHDIYPLQKICHHYGAQTILDATGRFGSTLGNKSLLDFCDYAVCSLHASQVFHTTEGGLIISRSTQVRNRLEAIRSGGQSGAINMCYGINGHMSELHAAFGLCLLPYIKDEIQIRKRHSEYYESHLYGSKVKIPHYNKDYHSNYACYPVLFPDAETAGTAMDRLASLNIYPRYPYKPLLTQLSYLENQYYKDCPVALDISRRLLHLPIFTDIPEERLHEITSTITAL